MIEPTETEGKPGLDAFVDAMREIARECEEDPEIVRDGAAHDAGQARGRGRRRAQPVLRWKP